MMCEESMFRMHRQRTGLPRQVRSVQRLERTAQCGKSGTAEAENRRSRVQQLQDKCAVSVEKAHKNGKGVMQMTRGQISKCRQIAKHYGRQTQEAQTISEVSELLYVLTRRQSQRGIDWSNDLIDEIADVLVMIQQITDIHGLEPDVINERVNYKLDRQLERIREEG